VVGVDVGKELIAIAEEKERPGVAFHLATHFTANHRVDDLDLLIESNLRFGLHLADALAQRSVPLVNVGTAWQCTEGKEGNPAALYAATKNAFEQLLRFYTGAGQFRVLSLRLFDSYGPGDPRKKLFWYLRQAALPGGAPVGMSGGEQLIDLLYVDDIVRGLVQASNQVMGQAESFGVASLSSGAPLSLRTVAERYERVIGRPLSIQWGKLPYRAKEMFQAWTAGPPLADWKPEVSLEDGIRRMEHAQ
jgi:nucleoside-diphosphate-sugar epimerase